MVGVCVLEGEGVVVAALCLAEVDGFGGEELGGEVPRGVVVGVAALAGLTELELCVRGLEALVVGWAAEGFFATGLEGEKGVRIDTLMDERFGGGKWARKRGG